MIWRPMPEFEFPGIFVEEAGGKPKPIDGVPTSAGNALTWADGPHFFRVIAIGGALLAGLGISLAMIRGNVRVPGGIAGLVAIFVSAFVLSMLRALVEWRRRRAGRPPLRPGRLALAVAVLLLAQLVALGICLLALVVSLPVAPAFTPVLLAAGLHVLIGCTWACLAGGALRDLLLLVQAARDGP
jgi:hypothetical protein